MFENPHARIWVPFDHRYDQFFWDLERLVPGALCYARRRSHRGRWRYQKDEVRKEENYDYTEVLVSLIGLDYVLDALDDRSLDYKVKEDMKGYDNIMDFPVTDEEYRDLVDEGRDIINNDLRVIKIPEGMEVQAWQCAGVSWCQDRPAVLKSWTCGSGKTLGTLLDMDSLGLLDGNCDVVIIAPVSAEHTWWLECKKWGGFEPFVHRPPSRTRKSDETYMDWRERVTQLGWPKVHIFGLETLPDWRPTIEVIKPEALVVDEIHMCASPQRWQTRALKTGGFEFVEAPTAKGNEKLAVALMNLARLESVEHKWGLTATPLDDGRPRRLFGPIDFLWPGALGSSYYNYSIRYCDRIPYEQLPPGEFTDDKGASNLKELKNRVAWIEHEVTPEEVRETATFEACRIDTFHLPPELLVKEDRYDERETYNQAILRLGRELKDNPLDLKKKAAFVEAQLAQACSKKRKWVINEVVNALLGGSKVSLLVARKLEAEVWAAQIARKLSQGDLKKDGIPMRTCHGDINDRYVAETIEEWFPNFDGPCLVVATGQKVGQSRNGLHYSDLGIIAQLPYNPTQVDQWIGRYDRLGGVPTHLKIPIGTNTYDEVVASKLAVKFGNVDKFMRSSVAGGRATELQGIKDDDTMLAELLADL